MMNRSRNDAIYCLLSDDDDHAVQLIREQLVGNGESSLPALRDILSRDDAKVTALVRGMISDIERRSAVNQFDELTKQTDEIDLEDAVWKLSKVFDPGLDMPGYARKLDSWTAILERSLSESGSAVERVKTLSTFLAVEQGFSGNAQDYYSPSNSLLSSVIDSRLGIPISLTALYMFVGARAGMKVDGINLPGHFIARHEDIYFDPFHQGRVLSPEDVAGILDKQGVPRNPGLLSAAPRRLILIRMLANLKNVFLSGEDVETAEMLGKWIRQISPLA